MNTQPIKQNINSLQSDSKLSVSSSPPPPTSTLTNGIPISNENNHPRQNIQLLNEIKREKFDLCTLPEFQFTTDCMPVKSHLTTFIGTAITCSVLILLLTFCAAYIRRRRIISRGKQDRQHLSKVQHSESGNVVAVETTEDKYHLSTLSPNDVYLKNGPLQLGQLKSLSFEGVLYTELADNNNTNTNTTTNSINSNKDFKSYPNCTLTPNYNISRNNSNTLLQQPTTVNSLHRQQSINCQVSPTTCSNTAYFVWTSNPNTPEIIQQTNQGISMQPLGKVLIHTDSQGQQQQHIECSSDPFSSVSTMTRNFPVSSSIQPLPSNDILLNSVSLINQNTIGTLFSSTTNDSVTSTLLSSGSKLCSPVIAHTTDVVSKVHPESNITTMNNNPLEVSLLQGSPIFRTHNTKDTTLPYAFCTNIAYNSSPMTDSMTSNLSHLSSSENYVTHFITPDTIISTVNTDELQQQHHSHLSKSVCQQHTANSLSPTSSNSPQTCIILDPDSLKFSSKLVYFCSSNANLESK
ncbi:unnamed protein product [Trichobilharzia szidati]|nr:unnamed protein product [Trichobilharzia szidati]